MIYKLRKLNIGKHKIFSEKDVEFMKTHYKDMTYKEIGNILGFTERQIRGKINNMGLTKIRNVNKDYFDVIDNSNKAYFLGFIFADGYITTHEEILDDGYIKINYEFGMQLQSGDRYILEKLNDELGGENLITDKEPTKRMILGKECNVSAMSTLRIFSKDIVLGLMKQNIVKNKSQHPNFPIVDDKFFFDWLRGYIDGDGCFWKYKNHYYLHITCAFEEPLKYIQNKLMENYNIETRLYKETDKKYRLMCINIIEMRKLVNKLYYNDDVICLSRKINRVQEYLNDGFAA